MDNFVIPTSANYTEFLRDYLKNNELPNALSIADNAFECDFKELFKNHYYMREIGFDSEELFKQKLETQCILYMQYYQYKALKLKTLFNEIFNTGFTITQTNNLTQVNSEDDTHTDIDYKTPIGSASVELPTSAIEGGRKLTIDNDITQTNTGTITTEYSKNPKFNTLEAITKMQEEFKNIIEECLNCFECLFMQIF